MSVNTDLGEDDVARALLKNVAKIGKTKTSGVKDDHGFTKGSEEVLYQENNELAPLEPLVQRLQWRMLIKICSFHSFAIWGLYRLYFHASWGHMVYMLVLTSLVNAIGATMGAHRYYSHRTFKANVPLRIIIMIFQTMSCQGSAWYWARNHRQHHKYSDTDADPHNASRGFLFSHIGWGALKRHPLVIEKAKEVNTADLDADEIVSFQKRYYYRLMFFFIFLSTIPAVYIFGATWLDAFLVSGMLRIILCLHGTFFINSWAHHFGTKPYDKSIRPVETIFVSIVASGDGWHNFHHAFPKDYRASELGAPFNLAANIIDMFAYIGWATDLKTVTPEMIVARAARTGDKSMLRNNPYS